LQLFVGYILKLTTLVHVALKAWWLAYFKFSTVAENFFLK